MGEMASERDVPTLAIGPCQSKKVVLRRAAAVEQLYTSDSPMNPPWSSRNRLAWGRELPGSDR